MAPSTTLATTAREFASATSSLSMESMIRVRSDDCITQILPRSLNRQALTNDDFKRTYGSMLKLFSSKMQTTEHSCIVDGDQNKVVLHMSAEAEIMGMKWANEYVYMLTMSEDGKRVVRVEEFVDSWSSMENRRRINTVEEMG